MGLDKNRMVNIWVWKVRKNELQSHVTRYGINNTDTKNELPATSQAKLSIKKEQFLRDLSKIPRAPICVLFQPISRLLN